MSWTRLASCLALCLLLPVSAWGFDYYQPLPKQPPIPASNPQSPAKIALGKRLYFDPQLLGADSKLSCNSCHDLSKGGDDDRALSIGQPGRASVRSAPGLWNIGFQTVLYWDGRATSLEQQTLDHLRDPLVSRAANLGATIDQLMQSADYRRAFQAAFPGDDAVSGQNLARAIASFERSLLAPNSPFDRYLAGDQQAISASAKHGRQVYNEVGCAACHFGTNFAGPAPGPAMGLGDGFYELFPNHLGSEYDERYQLAADLGRFEYTGEPWEKYMWRVPPLRNIAVTAPYFHNGSVATLEEAIRVMALTQLRKKLSEQETNDIAAFLRTLTGEMKLPH